MALQNEYVLDERSGQWVPTGRMIDTETGEVSEPKPEPDPEYLEEYSQGALEEYESEEEHGTMVVEIPTGEEETVAPDNNFDTPVHPADVIREGFTHIESWDEVISVAADLRQDLDQNKFKLGALVNTFCPRRPTGRPSDDDDRWNISSLAGSIGENRSTLSMLAANEEFWREYLDEIPPQVSFRQLHEARTSTGWKPGKVVEQEQIQSALDAIIKMADGTWEKPKKERKDPALETLAKRCKKAAEKALDPERKEAAGGDVADLFLTIQETALDILEILEG